MRDRPSRASGGGFRRSEGSDGSGAENLAPAWIAEAVGGSGTVVRRPAGVGDYRWIGDAAAFESLIDELASCKVYGLDTEFHRERTYFPQLALLQVSWESGIALVDPLAIDIAPFAAILDGPGLAVVHAAEQDLEVLERACADGAEQTVRHPGRSRFLRPGVALARKARRADPRDQAHKGRPADRLDAKAAVAGPACLRRRGRRPSSCPSHQHQRTARGDGPRPLGRGGVRHRLVQGPLEHQADRGLVEAPALATAAWTGTLRGTKCRRLA